MALHPLAPFALRLPARAWALALPACLAAALTAGAAQAQTPAPAHTTPAAPAAQGSDDIAWLEKTRHYTYGASHWLASSVDGWFGNKPFDAHGKVSGFVRVNTLWEQHDGFKANVKFRLRADLPNLQNKAYAFVGQDNKREVVTDQPENFSREQLLLHEDRKEDQSFFAGLGYAFMDDVDFRLGFRGGLKPYAQVRYKAQWALSPRDTIFLRESLFWSSRDSLGSTTVVDYEHTLSPTLLARWSTVGTITRRSDGLEWQSSVGLIKALPQLRTVSVEALVQGRTGSVDISNYGARASWRQPIYKDWLFGKVSLGHFWPKDKTHLERDRSWAVGASVEMHF